MSMWVDVVPLFFAHSSDNVNFVANNVKCGGL